LFRKITYRRKQHFLLGAAAVFALISYKMVFGKTLTLYKESKSFELRLEEIKGVPEKSARLRHQLAQIDALLSKQTTKGINRQDALLNLVTQYCQENKTVLREFPQAISSQDKEMILETNIFTVEGDFVKLLNLAYQLEQKYKIGKLSSCRFSSKTDPRTNTTSLLTTLYVQNVKEDNHEK
jgi:hypothetical protein